MAEPLEIPQPYKRVQTRIEGDFITAGGKAIDRRDKGSYQKALKRLWTASYKNGQKMGKDNVGKAMKKEGVDASFYAPPLPEGRINKRVRIVSDKQWNDVESEVAFIVWEGGEDVEERVDKAWERFKAKVPRTARDEGIKAVDEGQRSVMETVRR